MNDEKTTLILSEFISRLSWTQIPEAVRRKAGICLLDFLGASLIGIESEEAFLVRNFVRKMGGNHQSSALGMGQEKTSMALAALVNGVTGHAFEMDDAHRFATGLHPGATIIPAVLAMGEKFSFSPEDVFLAIVAGYEVAGRVGRAINPSHRYRGFHSTGTVASLGAAAAGARLLTLDAQKTAWAVGIAGSMAGGIFEFLTEGSMNKLLHAGQAAGNGVTAALLAEDGFTGPTTVLEGSEGFCRAFSDEYDMKTITKELGRTYEIEAVYFKRHASCGQAFAAIDTILEMRNDILSKGLNIRLITIKTYRAAAVLNEKSPDTIRKARFSIPFVTALALVRGHVGHFDYSLEILNDPEIKSLAQKVEVVEDEAIQKKFPKERTADLTIEFEDGSVMNGRVDIPKGMPENPLSEEELIDKFNLLAGSVIGPEKASRTADRVLDPKSGDDLYSTLKVDSAAGGSLGKTP